MKFFVVFGGLLSVVTTVKAFVSPRVLNKHLTLYSDFTFSPEEPRKTSPAMLEKIHEKVISDKLVLFMKGTKLFPGCGFSGTVVNILDRMQVKYTAFDVKEDDSLRQGIKDYTDWPTIPQLFIGGEFVGGSDIVLELYLSGELLEMIEVAIAS